MSRTPPPLSSFTFDTGITVQIRKLSPFFRDDVEAQFRRDDKRTGLFPMPPMVPGVEGKLEPNESDPDYLRDLAKYLADLGPRVQDKLFRIAIRRGVQCTVDHEAVAKLMSDFTDEGIEPILIVDEEDEKFIYVSRICIGSAEDISDLYNALFARSIPTREAVEAAAATFPSSGGR